MADRPLADSPPCASPDAGTPRDFDETLGRAIDAGRLAAALAAADPSLAGVFAAHQKLESLFAALRGEANDPLSIPERVAVASRESNFRHFPRVAIGAAQHPGGLIVVQDLFFYGVPFKLFTSQSHGDIAQVADRYRAGRLRQARPSPHARSRS